MYTPDVQVTWFSLKIMTRTLSDVIEFCVCYQKDLVKNNDKKYLPCGHKSCSEYCQAGAGANPCPTCMDTYAMTEFQNNFGG